mgnify:CR=1 FL=1
MANMSLEETYAEMRQAVSEVKECQARLLGACESQSVSVDMWLKVTLKKKQEAKTNG